MNTIGIPKALLYYHYYPFWKCFLEELGLKVITSEDTNKEILDMGVKSCVEDACLPVKVFHGHVESLRDKADMIFIPRLVSIKKDEFTCPKFCGLPEMIKFSIKDLPPIISTKLDMNKNNRRLYDAIFELGRAFSQNGMKILSAFMKAKKEYLKFNKIIAQGYTPPEAIEMLNNKVVEIKKTMGDFTIGLMGHPYNIYDSYINMNLIKKLRSAGINVMTPEMIDEERINKINDRLPKKMFWSFGRELFGSAISFIEDKSVMGVIYLSSFGCGQDAFISELVNRIGKRINNTPVAFLMIDEHTGEAGFDTRIEAFIDMIKWRVENEHNISTHG